jgi:hypothetical protein
MQRTSRLAVTLVAFALACSDTSALSALPPLDGVWDYVGERTISGTLPTTCSDVAGGLPWSSVSTGVYLYSDESTNQGTAAHTCGITTNGATWCWGDNLVGQLGIGTRTESYVPIRVSEQPSRCRSVLSRSIQLRSATIN